MIRVLYFILFIIAFSSCVNDLEEVKAITQNFDLSKDVADSVRIIYSDSGFVKLIIEAPVLERYNSNNESKDVFPKGILISFFNEAGKIDSWLKADYAERIPSSQKMIAKTNVAFYNISNDKLQSSELIWDEKSKQIYTEKFIRITRPMIGDTLYGLGLVTDQQFRRIEIKRRIKARLAAGDFVPQ